MALEEKAAVLLLRPLVKLADGASEASEWGFQRCSAFVAYGVGRCWAVTVYASQEACRWQLQRSYFKKC